MPIKMKNLIKISLINLAILFIVSCKPNKENSNEFTITKIQSEKDGQTLFLKNDKGEIYTTIISFPNGNFIEVHEGDIITMDIQDTLKMNPPAFISKNLQIISSKE